ncbi:hypothetical protein BD311DRAFT_178161 [Dichomitus squalens]|uniref:Uncharacterized protein n=1 Tax=Dichomitus squalens TaxID=114155 RepID=A0A4Q9M4U2_9APHY|nr:hypothetical protein BD311DRAFT_178161 [Dichomitus squalens]
MSVAQSPTPSVGHLKYVDPTSGPMQIDRKHAALVNYTICIATVLFGIALITVFALIIKWRKRAADRHLKGSANTVVRNNTISYLSPARRSLTPKFPPPGLSYYESTLSPLALPPTTPPPAYAATHVTAPCTCPACINGTLPTYPCPSPASCATSSNSSPIETSSSAYDSALRTPKPTRFAGVISALRSYPTSANRSPRTPSPNENAVRRSFQRTPPDGHVRSSQDSPLAVHGQARAVQDATSSSDSSASLTFTPPSDAFDTPSRQVSGVRLPALQELSGDGDTNALCHDGRTGSSIRARFPLDLAVSRGYLAHILVSPPSEDRLDALPDTGDSELAAHTITSATGTTRGCAPGPGSSGTKAPETIEDGLDDASSAQTSAAHPRSEAWFTEVDWFGKEGPLAKYDEHAPATASLYGQAF